MPRQTYQEADKLSVSIPSLSQTFPRAQDVLAVPFYGYVICKTYTLKIFDFVCLTKSHRLGGLNNRNVFITVLKAGNSSQYQHGQVEPSSWCARQHRVSLFSHNVGVGGMKERGKDREILLYKSISFRDSLAVQWLRLHFPLQGVWVQSLVREIRSQMICSEKIKT